jgi:hypothetical protein
VWWNALAGQMPEGTPQKQAQFCSIMHLRLEYCLIRMFVARPFLFRRESSSPSQSPSENGNARASSDTTEHGRPTTNSQKHISSRRELIDDGIQAAKESLEICRSLRNSGPGLSRASYIEYSSCRASLLVLIAYSMQTHYGEFRLPLRDGLDMIREISTIGDSARSEVSLIELLEDELSRLHFLGTQANEHDNSDSNLPSLTYDYSQFKNWESAWKSSAATKSKPGLGAAPADAIDNSLHDWSMSMGDYTNSSHLLPMQGTDSKNMHNSRPFHSSTEQPSFTTANTHPPSQWPIAPEAQILQGMFVLSDYQFDSSLETDLPFTLSS